MDLDRDDHFEFELPLVIGALIDRLFRIGHTDAATELRRGWAHVRDGSDDWRSVLQAVETVRGRWAAGFADQDQECLRNIEAEVRAGMRRITLRCSMRWWEATHRLRGSPSS